MDIDRVLANLPDDDDDPVPQVPSAGSVRLDTAFESADFGLEEAETTFTKRSSSDDDSAVILMHLPRGKTARISKRQLCACKNDAELRQLDRELYKSVGLDPAHYGL